MYIHCNDASLFQLKLAQFLWWMIMTLCWMFTLVGKDAGPRYCRCLLLFYWNSEINGFLSNLSGVVSLWQ